MFEIREPCALAYLGFDKSLADIVLSCPARFNISSTSILKLLLVRNICWLNNDMFP